ncbi:auxin-responsive protein SAUR64-like [Magnolia sinica]|uniref:auxin-responsive protein SAUR64-like n=1 Tax=Magnolia sinica TaxID=86752 RepID=UPI0026599AF4|nr:auxin-responsive protein SAUR64-like [Magnolia sinica]
MARKGPKVAAIWRRRGLSLSRKDDAADSSGGTTSLADKGHFVVYTTNKTRFVVPMLYLNNPIFKELLIMSTDEFGLTYVGPIIVPCPANFMENILSLIGRSDSKDVDKALLDSIATSGSSLSALLHSALNSQQVLLTGF